MSGYEPATPREHDSLTLPEVAARVGVNHNTIWRQARRTGVDGKITPGVSEVLPGVKVFQLGSTFLVSRFQVEEFLRSHGTTRAAVRTVPAVSAGPLTPERLEQLRRSVEMLAPGQPAPLDREEALQLVEEVQRLRDNHRRLVQLAEALRGLLAAETA